MTTPAIITVAITGSQPQKKDTPAVPITPTEQIAATREAYEAGASLVHIHVRNNDGTPSSDPGRFAEVQAGIFETCPGMIVQFSTGGRGREADQRGSMLHLKPDMASLVTGSVNFATIIYENPPNLIDDLARRMIDEGIKPEIEIFDLAMLYAAERLAKEGKIETPPHVQFVLGIPNALPARRHVLEFLIDEYKSLFPNGTWTAAGVGRHQLEVNHWALELGGHCRTGIEDNIRWNKDRLAASNAELVARVASLCVDYDRRPATPAEARCLLGLNGTA